VIHCEICAASVLFNDCWFSMKPKERSFNSLARIRLTKNISVPFEPKDYMLFSISTLNSSRSSWSRNSQAHLPVRSLFFILCKYKYGITERYTWTGRCHSLRIFVNGPSTTSLYRLGQLCIKAEAINVWANGTISMVPLLRFCLYMYTSTEFDFDSD